jgi:putative spermidine/putrescine transport system permease protein
VRAASPPSALGVLMVVVGTFALVFLVSPFVVVLPNGFSSGAYLAFPTPGVSLRWFRNFFASRTWIDAAITSFEVALAAAAIATVTGTAAAIALDGWSFRGKTALVLLLLSPLVIPAVIVGIAAYTFFVSIRLYGSLVALVLAHGLLGIPYVLLSVLAALNQRDPRLGMAALSLGASPWQTFREVTLPLAMPGVAGGAILAFVISFDDVVVATFLAGVRTTTLPMRMFQAVEAELDPTIAAASTLLVAFAALVLVALRALARLERRRSLATLAR